MVDARLATFGARGVDLEAFLRLERTKAAPPMLARSATAPEPVAIAAPIARIDVSTLRVWPRAGCRAVT
jgi:hypothetical protein